MKTYLYNELGYSEPLEITEEQILDTYYPFWSGELRKLGREDLISEKNCIEDWVVVNWAWEK